MKIGQTVARRIVWILTGLAVYALLSLVGIGNAHAQENSGCTTQTPAGTYGCNDQGNAMMYAVASAQRHIDSSTAGSRKLCVEELEGRVQAKSQASGSTCSTTTSNTWTFLYNTLCSARPQTYAGFKAPGGSNCQRGCMYQAATPQETTRIDQPRTPSINFTKGNWQPTGATCQVETPPTPPADDYCANLEGGHKMCRDSRGRNCIISAKTGRKYCPSTASSTLNATNPERTENISQSAPAPAPGNAAPVVIPRPGEQFTPSVTPTTTTTNNTTNTTTTVNTTINNNTSTPNKNPADGNPGDGGDTPGTAPPSGGGDGEEGEGKDGAKLTGGMTCDSPPVCSVDDDASCKTGMIMWQFQCGNMQEIGTQQADAANAVNLLELQWDEDNQTYAPGALAAYNEARTAIVQDVIDNTNTDFFGLLDSSGFLGGGQCPALPQMSVAGIDLPVTLTPICDLFGGLGLLVEALAYFGALRMITRG
jgi:hypothetical protein